MPRELVHSRAIVLHSFRRADGLWDIEGRLTDVRAEPVHTAVLDLQPGEAMHDMHLTLTIDGDMTIVSVRAGMDAAATPDCHRITGNYDALVGVRIGAGFRKAIAAATAGVLGCTHMTTLLQAMATAAVQALWHDRAETRDAMPEWLVNACHGYRADSEAVRLLAPHFYRTDTADKGTSE